MRGDTKTGVRSMLFTHLSVPLAQFEAKKLLNIPYLSFLNNTQVPSKSSYYTFYHMAIYFPILIAIPML